MNFDMKKFYGWGTILMIIAFAGNLWNSIIVWHNMTIGAKIANIAGSLMFNILLALVFYTMWKITPNSDSPAQIIDSPDLDALIKKYQTKTK